MTPANLLMTHVSPGVGHHKFLKNHPMPIANLRHFRNLQVIAHVVDLYQVLRSLHLVGSYVIFLVQNPNC